MQAAEPLPETEKQSDGDQCRRQGVKALGEQYPRRAIEPVIGERQLQGRLLRLGEYLPGHTLHLHIGVVQVDQQTGPRQQQRPVAFFLYDDGACRDILIFRGGDDLLVNIVGALLRRIGGNPPHGQNHAPIHDDVSGFKAADIRRRRAGLTIGGANGGRTGKPNQKDQGNLKETETRCVETTKAVHSHFVATVIGEFSSKAQALLIEVATKILKDRAYSFTREIHRVDGLAYYPETMVLRGTGCAPSGPKSRTAGDFRIYWARKSEILTFLQRR